MPALDPITKEIWLTWVELVEALLGHSLDGDQVADGYSLDHAYRIFETDATPKQAVMIFRHLKAIVADRKKESA